MKYVSRLRGVLGEDAIVTSVNRLLAEKGFDLMTVDEVAADVGIAKASLYKHFASKEALAAAAQRGAPRRSVGFADALRHDIDRQLAQPGLLGFAVQHHQHGL